MTDASIPVDPKGQFGTIRLIGQPDLIAHRPESWRFFRLTRIIGAAKAIATQELGADTAHALVAAMSWISDLKGDFTVGWHPSKHRPEFNAIVTRALSIEGETDIEFRLASDF
ncbi:MAG: hypothetical protein WDM79_18135 [Terricaulis sp.]